MTLKAPEARLYITDLTVFYGDQPSQIPSNAIREINGLSADINAGFGGKYVWLVPQYLTAAQSGSTGWEIIIQKDADPSLSDLAKGAGGDYRYLRVIQDLSQDAKVTSVSLIRLEQALPGVPAGWNGVTTDINKGRGGTYLYLVWKTSA